MASSIPLTGLTPPPLGVIRESRDYSTPLSGDTPMNALNTDFSRFGLNSPTDTASPAAAAPATAAASRYADTELEPDLSSTPKRKGNRRRASVIGMVVKADAGRVQSVTLAFQANGKQPRPPHLNTSLLSSAAAIPSPASLHAGNTPHAATPDHSRTPSSLVTSPPSVQSPSGAAPLQPLNTDHALSAKGSPTKPSSRPGSSAGRLAIASRVALRQTWSSKRRPDTAGNTTPPMGSLPATGVVPALLPGAMGAAFQIASAAVGAQTARGAPTQLLTSTLQGKDLTKAFASDNGVAETTFADWTLHEANRDTFHLILDGCTINADTIIALDNLTKLSKLTIKNCPSLTDVLISGRIKLLGKLVHLDLSNTGVTNITLAALQTHAMRLTSLCVAGTAITNLEKLSPNNGFQYLDISNCPHIRDEHLVALQTRQLLSTLLLSGCAITDDGLKHLAKTRIRTLHLNHAKALFIKGSCVPSCLGGRADQTKRITHQGLLAINTAAFEKEDGLDSKKHGFHLKKIYLIGSTLSDAEQRELLTAFAKRTVLNDVENEIPGTHLHFHHIEPSVRKARNRNRVTLSSQQRQELAETAARLKAGVVAPAAQTASLPAAAAASSLHVQDLVHDDDSSSGRGRDYDAKHDPTN